MGFKPQIGSKVAALATLSVGCAVVAALTKPGDWLSMLVNVDLPQPLHNLAEVLSYLATPFADLASWWVDGFLSLAEWATAPLFDLVVVDLPVISLPLSGLSRADIILISFLLPSLVSALVMLRDGRRARLFQRSRMALEVAVAWARVGQAPPDSPAAAAARSLLADRGLTAGPSGAPAPTREETSFAEAEAAARDLLAAMSVGQRKG